MRTLDHHDRHTVWSGHQDLAHPNRPERDRTDRTTRPTGRHHSSQRLVEIVHVHVEAAWSEIPASAHDSLRIRTGDAYGCSRRTRQHTITAIDVTEHREEVASGRRIGGRDIDPADRQHQSPCQASAP